MDYGDDAEALIRSLKAPPTKVRYLAASFLGRLAVRGEDIGHAVEPLIEVLKNDEDWTVREHAAEALGEIRDFRAVEPLIEILKKGDELQKEQPTNFYMALAFSKITIALGKIGDLRALEPLIEEMDGGNNASIPEALLLLGDITAVEPLIEVVRSVRSVAKDGAGVLQRYQAIRALGAFGDIRAIEPLIEALKDEDKLVRSFAATSLGQLRDSQQRNIRLERFQDISFNIQDSVITGDINTSLKDK